jgi:hypothetical protein
MHVLPKQPAGGCDGAAGHGGGPVFLGAGGVWLTHQVPPTVPMVTPISANASTYFPFPRHRLLLLLCGASPATGEKRGSDKAIISLIGRQDVGAGAVRGLAAGRRARARPSYERQPSSIERQPSSIEAASWATGGRRPPRRSSEAQNHGSTFHFQAC